MLQTRTTSAHHAHLQPALLFVRWLRSGSHTGDVHLCERQGVASGALAVAAQAEVSGQDGGVAHDAQVPDLCNPA